MKKLDTLNIYLDYKLVGGTKDFYDLLVISIEGKKTYHSLTREELNTCYKAFEIMNKKGKFKDV